MISLVRIVLCFAFLVPAGVWAQDIKGIATYKSQRKVDVELDSTQMDDAMQKQLMAMLKKQFEKEFTLEFTNDESVYKEVPKLEEPGMGGNAWVQVEVVGSGGEGVLYKNLAENRYANQTESFSKLFLIKDAIEDREWKLEKETKNIGQYTCFKATTTYDRTVMRMVNSNENGDKDSKEEESTETVTLTAWYTPQIPVKNGPENYDGLPGLILEIGDGDLTILCSKVVLNPEKGLDIKEPSQGKKVSREEYREIMDKKMKEMNERYQSDNRKGNHGNEVEIRIGG
ncbi:GLPGLI family protein [Aureisphaera galaxeae]|uniref:GLPGLI family protein n=1 Tax=Aureisphaera galaxeae TaxID=1538023 RepID=UPI00234FE015|nr:GLPGLI family protein [Aureisphaera galaxeae]MDC8003320.1 GLPGLI family protein [Aureisphaera galaxeae]